MVTNTTLLLFLLPLADETDPQKYLDKKEINKGHASGKQTLTGRGGVLWPLGETVFNNFANCSPDATTDGAADHHRDQVVSSCFRYYHGPTAMCRAVSPVVQLCRTSQAQQEASKTVEFNNNNN